MTKVLVVDDEARIRNIFAEFLDDCGFEVVTAENGDLAKQILLPTTTPNESKTTDPFDAILCDLVMPKCGGEELFLWMQNNSLGHVPFICISGKSDMNDVMSITQKGAFDFISKPLNDLNYLKVVVDRAITASEHHQGLISLSQQIGPSTDKLNALVGKSPKFLKIAQMIAKVAATDTTVLITGESGTGKEIVARSIHNLSNRNKGPFVAVNCAAIPTNLIESELFGYEKGAFTGANTSKTGKFTQANKGTIFLDEIGELDISLQSKLLRVLQERIIEPIGSTRPANVDVRILAATNRDLDYMTTQNTFRSDLLYRLKVYPIDLPPLRERKEDILPLCSHLTSKIAIKMHIKAPSITKEAFQKLMDHNWPGNIRELENTIERALIEKPHNGILLPEHITIATNSSSGSDKVAPSIVAEVTYASEKSTNASVSDPQDSTSEYVFQMSKTNFSWNTLEKNILNKILDESKGNISQAAKILQLSRSHLRSRLRFHGLGK